MNRHDRRAAAASGLIGPDGKPVSRWQPPRPIRVALVVPSMRTIEADTSMALTAMACVSQANGVQLHLQNHKGSMPSHARNSLVEGVLPYNPDYIMWTDADMKYPPDALLRLLNHNKDIVGCFYNKRREPYETLGHLKGPARDLSKGGLFEADYMPGGFVLVKADVYRKLPWPWYYEQYHRQRYRPKPMSNIEAFFAMMSDSFSEDMPKEVVDSLKGWGVFEEWLDRASKDDFRTTQWMTGEDYSFCQKARRHGYQIWCDIDLTDTIGHLGEQVVTCRVKGLQPAAPPPGAPSGPQDTDSLAL